MSNWTEESEDAQKAQTYGRTAALAATEHLPRLASAARPLVAHVAGAAAREGATFAAAAETFAPLAAAATALGYASLDLSLVGPSVAADAAGAAAWGTIRLAKTPYEAFLAEAPTKPDLVLAFHPGLFGHATWASAVAAILQTKSVFALAAYSVAEAERDLEEVRDAAAAVTVKGSLLRAPSVNPWGAVRARRAGPAPNGLWMDDCLALTVVRGG